MATPVQIILIVACACLVESRFVRERFNKTSTDDHHITEPKTEEPDAVIFPHDEEAIVFERENEKIGSAKFDKHDAVEDSKIDYDLKVKNAPLSLISKVVPEKERKDKHDDVVDSKIDFHLEVQNVPLSPVSKVVSEKERKDVTTNPIDSKDVETVTGKIDNDKEPVIDTKEDKLDQAEPLPNNDVKAQANELSEEPEIELNDIIERKNEIVPNFNSRFGATGNYMLVPVAANVQSYQPLQTNQNVMPMSTMQGNLPYQTHVPINELNTNAISPQHGTNVGSNVNYTPNVNYAMPTANFVPNVGTGVQYATPNIGSQYVAPNYGNNNQANAQLNTNTFVPVHVPNTYFINGQLYAAVTAPSNQVPSSLYYVNPQASSYQVANNMPLYKLVSISDGSQIVNGNTQYVPNNQ